MSEKYSARRPSVLIHPFLTAVLQFWTGRRVRAPVQPDSVFSTMSPSSAFRDAGGPIGRFRLIPSIKLRPFPLLDLASRENLSVPIIWFGLGN